MAGNLGLIKRAAESGLHLFPVPAGNQLFVKPQQSSSKNSLLRVTDVYGKTVLSQALQGAGEQAIDIHFLPAGTYYLILGNEVKKFIKE
jgi:hypothetical protein